MEPNQTNQPNSQLGQTPISQPVQASVTQPIMPTSSATAPATSPATSSVSGSHHSKWIWIALVTFLALVAIAFAYAEWWKVDSYTATGMDRDSEAMMEPVDDTQSAGKLNNDALDSEIDASINSDSESNLKDIDSEFR